MEKSTIASRWLSPLANPVLYKELSIGLRERKIFTLQTIYLIILSVALYLILAESISNSFGPSLADIGKIIYTALFWIQLVMVVLIAPSLTCGSISTEKEKKTYELLIGTLLTPGEIISGKLLNGVSFIFLLLISSLPITTAVFFLGGVSPAEIAGGYAAIFAAGFLCCQIGEYFSVREQKTANATNQSYMITIFFTMGLLPTMAAVIGSYHSNYQALLTYKSFTFPLWLFCAINFIAVAGFLFNKTVNHISNRAKNIHYLHVFFIIGYLFNLIVISAMEAQQQPDRDSIGLFLTFMLIGTLFVLGFFGRDASFTSTMEQKAYRRSVLSHPYFFPVFLSLTSLIPLFFLALEPGTPVSALSSSLVISIFYIFVFYALSRAVFRLFREKLPFSFFYYLLFMIASFAPYVTFSRNGPRGLTSSLAECHFLSPAITMSSLWMQNNFPRHLVLSSHCIIELHYFSMAFYTALLAATAVLLIILSRKK